MLLERHPTLRTLADFGLPEPTIKFDDFVLEPNRLIRDEMALQLDPAVAPAEWDKLNPDQLAAADAIVNAAREVNADEFPFLHPTISTTHTLLSSMARAV